MSAPELLRRAAQKLREAANHAEIEAPQLWYQAPLDPRPDRGIWSALQTVPFARVLESSEAPRAAEYIALMHPPVALANARLLSVFAELLSADPDAAEHFRGVFALGEVLDLARAVLREPDPKGGTDG